MKWLIYVLTSASAPLFLEAFGAGNQYEAMDVIVFMLSLSGIIIIFNILYAAWLNNFDEKSNFWDLENSEDGLFRSNFLQGRKVHS